MFVDCEANRTVCNAVIEVHILGIVSADLSTCTRRIAADIGISDDDFLPRLQFGQYNDRNFHNSVFYRDIH